MHQRSWLSRYGVALAATMVATLVRLLLDRYLENTAPFTAYYVAIMVTAWYGGIGPSLVAMVCGALLALFFFVAPRGVWQIADLEHQVGLGLYLVVGVVVAMLSESLHASRRRLAASEQQKREQVEAELAKAKDRIVRQTRLAAIGQVSASIAHDLRNPLSVVRYAIFFLRNSTPEDRMEWEKNLDVIEQQVATTDRIVENLLEAARAKEPQKEKVDFASVVHEVFHRVEGNQSIRLRMDGVPKPFIVMADQVQLRQVLANLVANAIQAMPEGGEVSIQACHDGREDRFVVEDSGPGVAPALRERLFEPLVSGKPKGTGLGLTICRQILERHGGGIELLDRASGTAFLIRLPSSDSLPRASVAAL